MQQTSATQMAQAERLLTDLLSVMQSYNETDPQVVLTLENLIRVYLFSGQFDRATEAAEKCRALISRSNAGPVGLARACNNIGVVYRLSGQFDKSKRVFAEAIGHANQTDADHKESLEALIRFNLGILQAAMGNWADAEQEFRTSMLQHEKELGSHHATIGDLANNLGVTSFHQGRYDEADTFLKRALQVWEIALGAAHSRMALGRFNLAAVYRTQGFFAEAEFCFQRALRIRDDHAKQLLSTSYEPFFSNVMEAPRPSWRPWLGPEVGLLHSVDLFDDPLAIDTPDMMERLSLYRKQVDALRSEPGKLKQTIEQLGPWYHNLEVQPELMTNPAMGDHPASRWRILEPFVPSNMSGKSVLDIGCNAGYFSLQMKRRGAGRVVSIDIMPHVLAQARFMSAWEDLPMEIRKVDTYDVETLGSFDYVVFVGVLYHLKHPLYALEKIANVCKDTMLFQSVVRGPGGDFNPKDDYPNQEAEIFDLPEYPKLYFVEKSFNGDISNWWFGNRSCLKAMLRTAGFREIVDTEREDTFICRK